VDYSLIERSWLPGDEYADLEDGVFQPCPEDVEEMEEAGRVAEEMLAAAPQQEEVMVATAPTAPVLDDALFFPAEPIPMMPVMGGGEAAGAVPQEVQMSAVVPNVDYAKWEVQLQWLFEMGFDDLDANVRALEQHHAGPQGLDGVVDALLNRQWTGAGGHG
jgi:hypothetical protein